MTLWERLKSEFADLVERLRSDELEDRAVSNGRLWNAVWDRMDEMDEWAYPVDIYFENDDVYALVAMGGKLYRTSITVSSNDEGDTISMGDLVEIVEIHKPVGRTIVTRTADGTYRWLSISSAAVLNRVGEIDSTELFDNMIKRAEESGEYPVRDFYHLAGDEWEIGQTDLLARDGYLYITSGTYNDSPLAQAVARATMADPGYWGDSITFAPIGEPEMMEVIPGVSIPVYNDGVNRKIATLPEEKAASLFTQTRSQEVSRMRQDVLDALEKLRDDGGLTQEDLDEFVGEVDERNRTIEEEDLIRRESDDDDQPDEIEATEPEPSVEEREIVLDQEVVQALSEQAREAIMPDLQTLADTITELREVIANQTSALRELSGRVESLERDEAQRREEWIQDVPRPRQTRVVLHSPRLAQKDEPTNGKPSSASIAADTLANMPAYR